MTGRKVFSEKLRFREKAASRIRSFENIDYNPKGSAIQIFNDRLPWLKHNKPNLTEQVKSEIVNKEYPGQSENKRGRSRFGFQNRNTVGEKSFHGKRKSLSDNQNDSNNKKNENATRSDYNTSSSNASSKGDNNQLNKENFKSGNNSKNDRNNMNGDNFKSGNDSKNNRSHMNGDNFKSGNNSKNDKNHMNGDNFKSGNDSKNDRNHMNNDNFKATNNASMNKTNYRGDRNSINTENSNTSNGNFSNSFNDRGDRNTRKNVHLADHINASTETDKTGRLSIEIQASMDRYVKNSLAKRLKKTMVNSITIPGNEIVNSDEKSYFTKHETKNSHYKSSHDTKRSNENLITSEMIDTILPSLPYSVRESNVKQYSTYTYPKVIRREPNPMGSGAIMSPVTHVGIDYLDQYWAHQRQNMINNENIPFHDLDYVTRSSRHNYTESHDEPMYLQEIFNKKPNYISKKINPNIDRPHDRVNIVTARNLDKIYV